VSFLTVCLNPTLQKTLRFSSVTPNAINRTGNHRLDASGKGINVTRVLTQLGKNAVHLTQLGGLRPLFLSLCEQDGLSVEWVESNSQIRFCYTLLDESDNSVTELIEESEPVSIETEQLLLEKYNDILAQRFCEKSFLIISGTKAAGFSDMIFPAMVKKAKEKGLKIILDIKGNDLLECLKYEPDVIKPNLDEFIQTFKLDPNAPQINKDLHELVMELTQKHKCQIILTNGIQKILAVNSGAKNIEDKFFEVEPVKIINSTGCGDAFTAGLAVALENGADFNTAIHKGIHCGALNAGFEKPGVIR
jgi:1-phosphofructokinase/tagatose 6-phosphate kinase